MAKPCLSTCHVTTLIAATDFVLCNFVLPRHAAVLAYAHCFVCFCCCLFVRHGDQLLSCGGGCCGSSPNVLLCQAMAQALAASTATAGIEDHTMTIFLSLHLCGFLTPSFISQLRLRWFCPRFFRHFCIDSLLGRVDFSSLMPFVCVCVRRCAEVFPFVRRRSTPSPPASSRRFVSISSKRSPSKKLPLRIFSFHFNLDR